MNDLNMYSGKHSIFEGMKQWVQLVFPPTNKFEYTSSIVADKLLDVIMGVPYKPGFELRIFNKVMACNLLYDLLTGKDVTYQQATHLYHNDHYIWNTFNVKALPEHK